MGETAAKLHMIFESMRQVRGVYFFDEFDAIGADRGAKNDVGEIRRVLNSFLQFLEQEDSESIVLAATNYEQMLDEALFRRFDDVIRYARPDADQVVALIRNRLHMFLGPRPAWAKVQSAAQGLSHAEIGRACDDAAKNCILNGRGRVSSQQLVAVLQERGRADHTTPTD
jgi:SpoVK/Ycf46/Vps4 family AAA+-type ATPase